jgi:hypothetical protein
MKKRILTTLCFFCGLVLAQNLEFIHYLKASTNPEYPYSIYVWNPNKQPLEISLKHNLSKLTPVTPELWRETLASVHFAPQVASRLIVARQTPQIPLNFKLETDAPIGVYNLYNADTLPHPAASHTHQSLVRSHAAQPLP